jgi:hypothetical protein
LETKFLDVVVAKPYSISANGGVEERTAWNKIGRAWLTKSGEAMNFELFMLPNQRYVIQFKSRTSDQASFRDNPELAPT